MKMCRTTSRRPRARASCSACCTPSRKPSPARAPTSPNPSRTSWTLPAAGALSKFAKPFAHFLDFTRRRGLVVVISDYYERPEVIVKTVEPLSFRGNEVILFHVLDPQEIAPKFREPVLLTDMETSSTLEVSPEYARGEYRHKIDS